MKSYPSSFSKDPLVQKGLVGANLKQTLKNIAGAAMNNMLGGGSQEDKEKLEENLMWYEYDYNDNLAKMNYTNYNIASASNTNRIFIDSKNRSIYENANKIPAFVLASINKYRYIYKQSTVQLGEAMYNREDIKNNNGKVSKKGGAKAKQEVIQEGISPSLFNPWFGVRAQGFTVNTPLMCLKNESSSQIEYLADNNETIKRQINLNNINPDFTDCSIKTLVTLSQGKDLNKNTLGRATYKYSDFMYCKELGKISNNHLITLRKFTHPIGDNIFADSGLTEDSMLPDHARLVTWFGTEDNKLEDICKFNFSTTWKEFNADLQDVNSKEDNPKILPSLLNITNGKYTNTHNSTGAYGNNAIYNWIEGASHGVFKARSEEGGDSDRYYKDPNKIWTPPNTIQSTHQYEGKIQFSHSFTLVFNYELRSYDGINPKSAFLDLIGNILEMTTRRGKFWGGGYRWLGAPRNSQGWKKMNELFAKGEKGAHDFVDDLFGCSTLEEVANVSGEAIKSLGNNIVDTAKNLISGQGFGDLAKKGTHAVVSTLTGMLKNKLGRPAIYALNSILNENNVGLWHVTIGNPRNPILSMGNLILEDAEIQHYGVLGIDDFPTGLKVTIKLKHAKPRDITTIASMYTCGQGGLLLPLNDRSYKDFFDLTTDSTELGFGGMNIEQITKPNEISNDTGKEMPETSMINTMWANLG